MSQDEFLFKGETLVSSFIYLVGYTETFDYDIPYKKIKFILRLSS